MELNNEFEVDRPIDEAWALLTDVERIAPAMPGAQLEEIEGDEFRGSVKVKVGPITANYKGKATFIEKDDQNHRAVLRAEGRDVRQGNANATITALLVPTGRGTKVTVNTDLAVTGKVAQFGRGVMAEVTEKLLNQFVQNLETKVLSRPATGAASTATPAAGAAASSPAAASTAPSGTTSSDAASTVSGGATSGAAAPTSTSVSAGPGVGGNGAAAGSSGVRKITAAEPVEPVDLLGATGAPLLKRLAPVLGVIMALVVALRLVRRRRRRG
jgi:carbon monoxide dehydrogenase subunit G